MAATGAHTLSPTASQFRPPGGWRGPKSCSAIGWVTLPFGGGGLKEARARLRDFLEETLGLFPAGFGVGALPAPSLPPLASTMEQEGSAQSWGACEGTEARHPRIQPSPYFRDCRGARGRYFRAGSSRSHWLSRSNNYDHILILLAAAYCLLVVKDLLSIHQPPIFTNYTLRK